MIGQLSAPNFPSLVLIGFSFTVLNANSGSYSNDGAIRPQSSLLGFSLKPLSQGESIVHLAVPIECYGFSVLRPVRAE